MGDPRWVYLSFGRPLLGLAAGHDGHLSAASRSVATVRLAAKA